MTIYHRKNAISVLLALFALLLAVGPSAAQQADSSIRIGHTERLYSKTLGESRTLYVHTPSNMKQGDRYPVLYLLDGESFIEMAAGQAAYLSESYKIIPSLIIVAIRNTDRVRDFTPTHFNAGPDGKPDTSANAFGKNSGGAEKFIAFLRNELLPYIEAKYPVAPYRILAGHSLGGLLAVHCLTWHPDLFNGYIAASPSLQWDNESALHRATEELGKSRLDKRFFLCDANEGGKFHANQVQLDSVLKQRNIPGLRYKYVYYPGESHLSEPVKAFYDGLRHVYPEWHLNYNSAFRKTATSALIRDHYRKLSADYGYTVVPLQDEVLQISRFFRNDPKRIPDAIDLLEAYLPSYPDVPAMQELLGDVYLKSGDTEKARSVYRKLLQQFPGNKAVEDKLKAL
ncbi:MAG: hypothetical protein EOO16_09645 [Chitinophagaceae bacterium]|nr:MAG: hypothetical protein EOO16_09645 [Chitinophagaceae bacterium]